MNHNTKSSLDDTFERIKAKSRKATLQSNGWYKALCPAHDDHKPSYGFRKESDRIRVKCQTGCTTAAICAALGIRPSDLFDKPLAKEKSASKQIVATYDYRDESGELLYQNVRSEPKKFRQRRPDENAEDGWSWELNGVRRVPYHLPEIGKYLQANPNALLIFTEGEKDADNLNKLGFVATSFKTWTNEFNQFIKGANAVLMIDHDRAGIRQASKSARIISEVAASLKVVDLYKDEPLPEKHGRDVSDWLADGNTADALQSIINDAPLWNPAETDDSDDDENLDLLQSPDLVGKPARQTHAEILLEIVKDWELFHTTNEDCFAIVSVNNHLENLRINSKAFRSLLSRKYYEQEKKTPSAQSLTDVIENLRGRALFDSPCIETHIRVAEHENDLFIDLCESEWRAIRVSKDGWETVESKDIPVKFRRTRGMMPLPLPEQGGDFETLERFVNVLPEDFILLKAWLVNCFRPNRPFPVLALHGEHGSAKTTTSEILRSLIDPNQSPVRSKPREERDLMISATNSWLLAFDNLSGISAELSDALCRLATGGGLATRELFADVEETLFNVKRPTLINGIDELATRPDLLDRSIVLKLPPIPENRRKTRDEFDQEFEQTKPKIFGAMLDRVSQGLREIGNVKIERLPRMADFALFGVACFGEEFLNRYGQIRAESNEVALESSTVGTLILRLMERQVKDKLPVWRGTSNQLLSELRLMAHDYELRSKFFPSQPNQLSNQLNRIIPNLRQYGITIERGTGAKRRDIIVNVCETSALSASSASVNENQFENMPMFRNTIGTGEQNIGIDGSDLTSVPMDDNAMPMTETTIVTPEGNKNQHYADNADDADEM